MDVNVNVNVNVKMEVWTNGWMDQLQWALLSSPLLIL